MITEEEKRNGWTEESLKAYLAEREKASGARIDPESRKAKPMACNSKYDVMRWR